MTPLAVTHGIASAPRTGQRTIKASWQWLHLEWFHIIVRNAGIELEMAIGYLLPW